MSLIPGGFKLPDLTITIAPECAENGQNPDRLDETVESLLTGKGPYVRIPPDNNPKERGYAFVNASRFVVWIMRYLNLKLTEFALRGQLRENCKKCPLADGCTPNISSEMGERGGPLRVSISPKLDDHQ